MQAIVRKPIEALCFIGTLFGIFMSSPIWVEGWVPRWVPDWLLFWTLPKSSMNQEWYETIHKPAEGVVFLLDKSGIPDIPGGGEWGPVMTQLVVAILIQWIAVGFTVGIVVNKTRTIGKISQTMAA
jgi:hypothetical protein